MKGWIVNIGWLAMGLLLIAATLVSAGRQELTTEPTVDSYYPSGTSALAALLKQRGYDVVVDRHINPKLAPGDVALAFYVPYESSSMGGGAGRSTEALKSLHDSVTKGATVYWLPLSGDYRTASNTAKSTTRAERYDGKPRGLSLANESIAEIPIPDDTAESSGNESEEGAVPPPPTAADSAEDASPTPTTLLQDKQNVLVDLVKDGKGLSVGYADGIGLTNRFLDKADNAQAFLETLAAVARPHARVVLAEATFGNVRQDGLLETIGGWAQAAWYQLLFFFAVVLYTLNRRFGLPKQFRPVQKGSRELLDAVTDTFTRAKANTTALEAAGKGAEAQLRIAIKLPRDAGQGELFRVLPETLAQSLAEVKAASAGQKVPTKKALELIEKLEQELTDYLATRRRAA